MFQNGVNIVINEPVARVIKIPAPVPYRILATTAGPPGPPGASSVLPKMKSGVVAGASFSGTPLEFAVVFVTPHADDTYSISISGTDERLYTYKAKTAAGFTISSNASVAISGEVSWRTMASGET